MILHSLGSVKGLKSAIIGKIITSPEQRKELRKDLVLLWNGYHPPEDSPGYLAVLSSNPAPGWELEVPIVSSMSGLDYLSDGDIISVGTDGFVRTLYRRNSPHNFLLMTEQCNSYCLMCSQPPKKTDDRARMLEHFRLIDLMDPNTRELGITGGEPTLFGNDFLSLIRYCKERLPNTALHVLTNGRLFSRRKYARDLAEIAHPDVMLGIPLYSDVDSEHDYVVQARGAFDETILGLLELAKCGVQIEIRVVIHKQTSQRLPHLAEFIARNLPFASKVALMGLEITGFVRANMKTLWIDPFDYQDELRAATEILDLAGLNVSIYNHQLCVMDPGLRRFACKSISDWKNIYLEDCQGCLLREDCGGFFQSALSAHSSHIKPFLVA
jgi:His-Xaa-Ser system radical SAM maturase HxsC